jgi:putative transposase
MPRPVRLNIVGVPQHVTQRGNNRQACFFSESDYQLYLNLLLAASERHACEIHAYVLMTNHVHLLVTPLALNGVSLLFRDLGRDYVRITNKTYKRTGTMWEGRFKSSLVDSERYCLTCYRYIELNPVRAGMVKLPEEYTWSSFRSNGKGQHDPLLSPHQSWLALGDNDDMRRKSYLNLFDQPIRDKDLQVIRKNICTGLPTGGDRFRKEIESALSIKFGNGKRGRPFSSKRT